MATVFLHFSMTGNCTSKYLVNKSGRGSLYQEGVLYMRDLKGQSAFKMSQVFSDLLFEKVFPGVVLK